MFLKYFFLLGFLWACAFQPTQPQRHPAQAGAVDPMLERLGHWEPVRENFWDRFYHDPLIGLFVNSERPIALDLIKEARRTIDIEIYEMKDVTFRLLLLEALERGVKVRIIKDSATVGDSCNELDPPAEDDDQDCGMEKAFTKDLMGRGAEYVWFNKKELCGIPGRSCFQHGKLLIIDNKYLLMSTGNFNSSSFCNLEVGVDKCNRDYSYVTKNRKVIDNLMEVMQLDRKGISWDMRQVLSKSHTGLTISPESSSRLISLLRSAHESIWIQNQYLEDPAINQILLEKAQEGVKVHVQIAAFCSFGQPSPNKKEKTLKIYSEFDEVGIQTKVFHSKMQINGKPGYMHAKAIIVDESVAWIGSINGSQTSSLQNREFGIIFKGKESVKKLLKTVSEDFNHPLAQSWQESLNCGKGALKPQPAQ